MDKLEPIRQVFRQCGLYNHAADDLLCERLAEAMTPKTCACESVLCMNECECAVRGKTQSDAAVSAKPVAWVHTWEYPGADSLTESFSWKPADEFLRDTVPVPSSIVSSVPLYAAPPAALAVIDKARDLLAALDAARGEAVAVVNRHMLETLVPNRWIPVVAPSEERSDTDVLLFAAPPAAAVSASGHFEVLRELSATLIGRSQERHAAIEWALERIEAQPAAAVPAANVTPMRQPRADLARLVESIKAAVYANGDGLSVTEAIGALELAKLELAKLELLKEQEQ